VNLLSQRFQRLADRSHILLDNMKSVYKDKVNNKIERLQYYIVDRDYCRNLMKK